ncbi:DVU0298 family protein, partial [Thermodesulfobacteriota bacterium]
MTRRQTSIRVIKKKVIELLKLPSVLPALEELSRIPDRLAVNSLFSFLYSEDPLIKWNAVTSMGAIVSKLAHEDMEAARVVIRRLMWNLNDESGGIGWGSPEAIGEILSSHKALAEEYSP